MSMNPERDADITRLYAESELTITEIGKMFGISKQRVYQIAHLASSYRRKTKQLPEDKFVNRSELVFQEIVNYKERHDGLSPPIRDLSQATGLSNVVLYRILGYLEHTGQIRRPVNAHEGRQKRTRGIVVVGGKWTYGEDHE